MEDKINQVTMLSLPKENEKLNELPKIIIDNQVVSFSYGSQLPPVSDMKSDTKLGTCREVCSTLYR